MDGLSAAASGIGVVSLAIQVVNSVREIQRFLRNVSDAPKELRRLINLLEQLELILENIGILIKEQRKQSGDIDIDMSPDVWRAIKTCEDKVRMLKSTIKTVKRENRATNKTTKALESFRLACKKKDIEEFESQLQSTLSLLNLAMTTNLTLNMPSLSCLHLLKISSAVNFENMKKLVSEVIASRQITTTATEEPALLLHTNLPTPNNPSRYCDFVGDEDGQEHLSRRMGTHISRRGSVATLYYGLLGKAFVKRKSQSTKLGCNGKLFIESYSKCETTLVFMASFLSTCVEFQYVSTFGSIQRSLRTYPLLPYDHPIWDMCGDGDLKGMQTILGERQVSPFSVDSGGWTLLHNSTISLKPEICKFLFDLGLNGQEETISGQRPFVSPPNSLNDISELRDTYTLFASRLEDIDKAAFCSDLFSSLSFEPTVNMFNEMVHEWVSKENIHKYGVSPILMAIRMLWKSESALSDHWKESIQRLLALRQDLHKSSFDGGILLLDDIMSIVDRPFDSLYLGDAWLDILGRCGVNVVEYLRNERVHHSMNSRSLPLLYPHRRSDHERYLIISEDIPRVSWEWFIDPEGKAFDVLEEFKNFGPATHNIFSDYCSPESIENWPFIYPGWQYCAKKVVWVEDGYEYNKQRRIFQLFEDRFERRQCKKATKLTRARGMHEGSKMPGAWID